MCFRHLAWSHHPGAHPRCADRPSLFSVIWFSIFGTATVDLDRQLGGALSAAAERGESVALFNFLEQFPLTTVMSVLFLVLVWIFFVAGADAGTVVLGIMSAGGVLEPRPFIKLAWGAVMAALAGILLFAGGLDALQNGAIVAATPCGFLMIALCWSLHKTLADDYRAAHAEPRGGPTQSTESGHATQSTQSGQAMQPSTAGRSKE